MTDTSQHHASPRWLEVLRKRRQWLVIAAVVFAIVGILTAVYGTSFGGSIVVSEIAFAFAVLSALVRCEG